MKMKLCKLLHFLGLDALLMKLLERLVAALNKKLSKMKEIFEGFLTCRQNDCECAL
ncbi:MAG: hypothetical protein IJ308_03255 [Clostridia bacterium]|nr:hypothetical protein [Clostridia bacterium]